jgi:hypothetical protein
MPPKKGAKKGKKVDDDEFWYVHIASLGENSPSNALKLTNSRGHIMFN